MNIAEGILQDGVAEMDGEASETRWIFLRREGVGVVCAAFFAWEGITIA